jgi:amidase
VVQNDGGSCEFSYGGHVHRWSAGPFLGTIATAPEFEVLSTLTTSFGSIMAAGGNLDCCAIAAGATVYLQSMNPGGLLYFGDMHASQGDGELCGVANEVSGRVRISCDVVKRTWLRNVRVVNATSLISLFCYRPVEEAMRQATRDLILWLEREYGFTKREAYLLVSMCPDFHLRTYQMCAGLGRLMITVGAEFPRYLLRH